MSLKGMINTQMADKLPELKDQFLVQYILGEIVNQVCNCEMIEQNSIDEMEDYPFVTINWNGSLPCTFGQVEKAPLQLFPLDTHEMKSKVNQLA